MTLIVGIRCTDGVVLGGDSAATYGTGFQPTIKQQTSKKLNIIGEQVVLGVSGPVGLAQSYASEIESLLQNKGPRQRFKKVADAKKFFSDAMWKHAKPAWERANLAAQGVGQSALQEVLYQSVAAFPVANSSPCLLQFTNQCQPEEANTQLPFVSIGIGQPVADPFLAFIRRIFWPEQLPALNDGILATLWTITHAIHALPGGVAGPVQVVTLSKDGEGWKTRELSGSELGEHQQMIAEMEDWMREVVKGAFTKEPTSPMPGTEQRPS